MKDAIPTISRMTLGYEEIADRVSMASELEGGETLSLVFTRRFLTNLVQHLITCKQHFSEPSPQPDKQVLSWESAAATQKAPEEPVKVSHSVKGFLIASVDVTLVSQHVVLDWKDREGGAVARLLLAEPALSAWLTAVEECFKQGAWSQEAWSKERASSNSLTAEHASVTVH